MSNVYSRAAALLDDSGHFSSNSDSEEDSFALVKHELLKTRSEVERLSKSEQWYKQELQSQKHSRLATLERLYAQERKYMLESQQLQQETQRLLVKCKALENDLQATGAVAIASPAMDTKRGEVDNDFEMQQHLARLRDQQQLIAVLRKQKKELLEDIQRMTLDNDEKQLQLQQQLVEIELEKKNITQHSEQLLIEHRTLAHKLELKASALISVTAEREQLRQVIDELNQTLQTQEQLLGLKEQEFLDLKHHYQEKLSRESSIEAIHNHSLAYHEEIKTKTSEIAALKLSQYELQTEHLLMLKLQSQNAEQQEQLEQLSLKLKAQQLDQTLKDAQIRDLTSEKKMLMEQLQQTQPTILHLEQQLKDLREKFADTCANLKYSHCKLELEISENYNQQQKLKVLQEQLDVYMQTPKNLSDSSTQTEGQNVVDSSALEQRIKSLELQLQAVKKQKHETVGLLQELLQQQNEKIKNTNEMESDWQQLLDALQATQKLEQNMQLQLQQKADELHQLNELFARQNEQLEQLQELSEAHERRSAEELQELKQVQAQDEANLSQLRHQVALLEESETVTREHHKTLLNLLETETGLNLQHVNSMPQLMKVLRQQLRAAKASEELPTLKSKLAKVSEKHARALDKIKLLEQTLAAERERFEASDAGKSTASIALIEPAHEVANLIDDYKKLIQQTAEETGRPRNSYILELIERSQQCQPNLCQLSEGVAACRADMMSLNRLLVGLNPDTIRQQSVPSLMEELRAVTEHT